MRHDCNKMVNGKAWMICVACQGRIHKPGCTSKLDPKKDCCQRRHRNLIAKGQTVGIMDESFPMDQFLDLLPE